MTERNAPPTENRVVITIDSDSYSDTTIEYAVTVAARLQRPLHGVFIEDTDLISSAALPFTTEICLTTGQPRTFNTGSLQSVFSEIASRFQQRLAQRAEKKSVRWSVSSVRGRRRDFQFDNLSAADYCIYECVSPANRPPSITPRAKQLLVIDGAGEPFYQTLATLLAPMEGDELHITLVETAPGDDTADIRAFVPARTKIDRLGKQELLTTLQHADNRFDYVVVSRQRWLSELAPLLAKLSCPLIVVG